MVSETITLPLDDENSVIEKYNKFYNISASPMIKIGSENLNRKTCYNVKPQILSCNLPSAFDYPIRDNKRKYSKN